MNFSNRTKSGFTVVELLVSVTIAAILIGVTCVVCKSVAEKGKMTREIAAGKNLIVAYQLYANDNNGRYMPALDTSQDSVWYEPAKKEIDNKVIASRYAFRLAPYFDYKLEGVLQVNDLQSSIDTIAPVGHPKRDYYLSLFTTFGINYKYVGGNTYSDGKIDMEEECVTRMAQVDKSLLVFASAAKKEGKRFLQGYTILTPPRINDEKWSNNEWTEGVDPGFYGNVDPRYNKKAICVFLDGSIQTKTINELRDMRLWSKNAIESNDPEYTIQ